MGSLELKWENYKLFHIAYMVSTQGSTYMQTGWARCKNKERAIEMGFTGAGKDYPEARRKDIRVIANEIDLRELSDLVEIAK